MKQFLFFVFIILSTMSYAQKEVNIWYFGREAGLDFNCGKPLALTDGTMRTTENCASITDENE